MTRDQPIGETLSIECDELAQVFESVDRIVPWGPGPLQASGVVSTGEIQVRTRKWKIILKGHCGR
jgi:hypothetical protein